MSRKGLHIVGLDCASINPAMGWMILPKLLRGRVEARFKSAPKANCCLFHDSADRVLRPTCKQPRFPLPDAIVIDVRFRLSVQPGLELIQDGNTFAAACQTDTEFKFI